MFYRLFPLTILLFGAIAVSGQTPQSISVENGHSTANPLKEFACADQYAGTISFSNFMGQSNDIDLDTIYLCEGDRIDIDHNGDADLTGDPNNMTTPGITYAWFDCPPTITGPNLAAVALDPCIFNGPPPPAGDFFVTAGGSFNGDITFQNLGSLQTTFNNGDPLLLWFAPITIDNFANKQYENDPVTGESGPCVNMNVDEAFAVVYLNEIEVDNFMVSSGSSGCGGEVTITGGLPEFDGSDYDITIQLLGNPNVFGTIISGSTSHGEVMEFTVPTPGFYQIIVEDGKSCGLGGPFTADLTGCVSVSQSIENAIVAPGDNICINVTVEDGFEDIVSMQYAVTWDETVLEFTEVTNLTPLMPNFSEANSFNSLGDTLIFAWGSLSGNGVTLPDGEVVYQICFDVVGNDGDCTDVEFITPQGSTIEVVNENGAVLGFNGIAGQICVSNSALIVDLSQDSVSCFGEDDGSIIVTVSGGSPPYSVTWQDIGGGPVNGPGTINVDGGTFTINNLEAGVYEIEITDSQGTPLVANEQIDVQGPPELSILFLENPGQCNGDLGSITATLVLDSNVVANPTANYDFIWNTMATMPTISNLNSGNYSLTVTEMATGCTVENSTFLPQPPPLSINISIDSAQCSGIGDGQIFVTVSGGTPNNNGDYHIELPTAGSGVDVMGTQTSVMGLEADIYPLIVTDNNGCSFQTNINLPAIKVLTAQAIVQNVACNNPCSGSISILGVTTGGTAGTPYNFSWFGSPPPQPPIGETDTTSAITGLCVGTYTLVLEDTDGCQIDTVFNIVEPDPLDVTIANLVNESCQPGMDGSIAIGVTGGTYPYNYLWDNMATDSLLTGLSAGNYMVTVTDNDGCGDSLDVMVIVPVPPTILGIDIDTLNCDAGMDGTLTVQVTSGDAPISSFDWSNNDSGQTINGLGTGEYIVTVTDDNNCIAIDTGTVVAPPPLVVDSIILQSPQCPGSGGGQVTVFASGGTGPYFFNWSNNISGIGVATIGGSTITAGQYDVTITDANNCSPVEVTATLTDPPSIEASFSAIDSVSCPNANMNCDGTATAMAGYSDGSTGMFDFTWISGETDNDVDVSTAAELCQGTQQVIISDGTCFDTFLVVIPAPPPIVPGQDITNVSCNGLSDGSITLMPTGGTPPYSYNWTGGQTGAMIDGLIAGNYTAVITDSKGCDFTHTVTIIEPEPLVLSLDLIATRDVSCNGSDDGIISVIAQGGNLVLGDPTYIWQNGIAPPNSSIAEPLSPGDYSVTVVDIRGCEDTLTHTIAEPSPIQFRIADFEEIPCFGGTTFITVDSVWGGQQTATYQFRVDQGGSKLIGDPAQVRSGTLLIEVTDVFNDCTVDTMITISEPLPMEVDLPQVVEIELGDSMTMLDPVIISSLPIDSFLWEPPNQLSCADCKNPTVNATENQLYTLTITDINGCTASATVLVDVDKNRNVYIPNVFSPNGDGINDDFKIYTGPGVVNINFARLYDRWGELLFELENVPPNQDGTPGWDGSFRGQDMKPGVFLYLIEVEFLDGQVLLYRGDVTLVR